MCENRDTKHRTDCYNQVFEIDIEETESMMGQNRIYSIVMELGCFSAKDLTTAMDECLNVTDEIKAELEKESNRLGDGFIWGVTVTPFEYEEDSKFYRGRQFIMEYIQFEDRIFEY